MTSSRGAFAKKSLEKAKGFTNDPLIQFAILWIGLNALYDDAHSGRQERETDKIKRFFQENKGIVQTIMQKRVYELQEMQKVIAKYPRQHEHIAEYLQSRGAIFKDNHPDAVTHLGELLNQVRNNMFHAVKDWEEEAEQKLISTINPIVEDIVSALTSI